MRGASDPPDRPKCLIVSHVWYNQLYQCCKPNCNVASDPNCMCNCSSEHTETAACNFTAHNPAEFSSYNPTDSNADNLVYNYHADNSAATRINDNSKMQTQGGPSLPPCSRGSPCPSTDHATDDWKSCCNTICKCTSGSESETMFSAISCPVSVIWSSTNSEFSDNDTFFDDPNAGKPHMPKFCERNCKCSRVSEWLNSVSPAQSTGQGGGKQPHYLDPRCTCPHSSSCVAHQDGTHTPDHVYHQSSTGSRAGSRRPPSNAMQAKSLSAAVPEPAPFQMRGGLPASSANRRGDPTPWESSQRYGFVRQRISMSHG
jgi:hypothetical protein